MSNMWCLVTLTNSVVKEVELDAKALGQDCLDKVCKDLGILETDFFGLLQIQPGHKHDNSEGYWLNLRNGLLRQLSGSPPYRLQLRVKFYVKPHYTIQLATRCLILDSLKQDLKEENIRCTELEIVRLLGLVSQAEIGDYQQKLLPALKEQYKGVIPNKWLESEGILDRIAEEHKKHLHMKKATAVYKALKEASEWKSYGVEWHHVRLGDSTTMNYMGVGPEHISLYDQDWELLRSIEYAAIQKATHSGKCFYLHTNKDDGSTTTEMFKLPCQKASNALYRCVTEMYLFYLCDTVNNDVSSQFDRDLKGTLASLFSENKEMGKKYVFDIKRTLQEAYDYNRRRLFSADSLPLPQNGRRKTQSQKSKSGKGSSSFSQRNPPEGVCSDGEMVLTDDEELDEEMDPMDCGSSEDQDCQCVTQACKAMQSKVQNITDSLLCKVCMDQNIDTVFCPCGHVACCTKCAQKLQNCPLCRSEVTTLQPIYLPSFNV